MRFVKLTEEGNLWPVHYDEDDENVFSLLFSRWKDPMWLREFFMNNYRDLISFFNVFNVEEAVLDTFEDRCNLMRLLLDSVSAHKLHCFFRPLDNNQTGESVLRKDKARLCKRKKHPSWLRLYALKFGEEGFLITGGAIKLTQLMADREHTNRELIRLERVRSFLVEQGAVDIEGFLELVYED